jgi:hypothetical protein
MGVPAELGSEIELRMLENRSDEPGVERLIQAAMHEEFLRRGALEPHYSKADGLVMRGVVREVILRHTGYSSVGLALEDEIAWVVDLNVAKNGEVVWQRNDWQQSERFTTSADPGVYRTNKTQALRRMSSELAGRVHDELLQSF